VNNNFTEKGKTREENVASEILIQSPTPLDNALLFQIFFLAHDQSQSVEVVETGKIDFGAVIHHLKMGECVFIKSKNHENLESNSKVNKEKDRKHWYFTHC